MKSRNKILSGRRNGEGRSGAHAKTSIEDSTTEAPAARKPGRAIAQPGAGGAGEQEKENGKYRRNGNVARLAKEVRDRINVMIRDGVPYREIIEGLGKDGQELCISSLSRWKDGGYQDWLVEQAFIERIRARQETPGELVRGRDTTEVNQAALQLGTLHIFEALRDLGPGSLNDKLGGDCAAFARLLSALARASRESMELHKYREACARARTALQPMKDPKRKLTDSERRAIVLEVDNILGVNQDAGCEFEAVHGGGTAPERSHGSEVVGSDGPQDGKPLTSSFAKASEDRPSVSPSEAERMTE